MTLFSKAANDAAAAEWFFDSSNSDAASSHMCARFFTVCSDTSLLGCVDSG